MATSLVRPSEPCPSRRGISFGGPGWTALSGPFPLTEIAAGVSVGLLGAGRRRASVRRGYQARSQRKRIDPNAPNTMTIDRKRHTSELQSRGHLVCRLLLEKKKT